MSLPSFNELRIAADQARSPVAVVAAGGADATVLQALARATESGWVRPLVAGDPVQIREVAESHRVDLSRFTLLPGDSPADVALQAIAEGQAEILMKGQIDTPALVRALLDPRYGQRIGRTIFQVVLMEIPAHGRRFLLSDTGVTIQPTPRQKQQILQGTVHLARLLGTPIPRVALVAATEKLNPAMPETVEIVDLRRLAEAGEFGPALVEGPLSFDLAYAPEAGTRKSIRGGVVGAADALVFPNLLSANLTVKAIMYTADCQFGGVLCGARCPVVFMSRADDVETRLNSLALALAWRRSAAETVGPAEVQAD